jgi:hypothetical protein
MAKGLSKVAAVALAAACLICAAPARSEIEKLLLPCEGKICPFFRASVTAPDGWVEDKEATNYFKAVFMLPNGKSFDDAPAKIYAIAVFNREKKPISVFLPDMFRDWKSRSKDAKVTRLDDLPRAGKPAFIRHQFEAPRLKEQGFELQSVTTDADKDGNEFIVTITVSANSRGALKKAEPAYRAILEKY